MLLSGLVKLQPSFLGNRSLQQAFDITSSKEINNICRAMASSSIWEEKKALRKETSKKLKQMEDSNMLQQSKADPGKIFLKVTSR